MSAPQIPNLNSLRRGGLTGRGRGRGDLNSTQSSHRQISKDEIIRNTDNDAATSRLSAVEAGYLDDPFAKLLSSNGDTPRRLPLMNRGTYVRTTGIDRIVDTFLSSSSGSRKQIISLGAGSDTRYFRLKRRQRDLDIIYHELDFEANTKSKIARIRAPPFLNAIKTHCGIDMLSAENEVLQQGSRFRSPNYHIHPQDLRNLSPGHIPIPDIDPNLPTLLISECCLIYLPPDKADAVLDYFTQFTKPPTPLAIVIYEPIKPYDAFGRTMVTNLIARGIQLQTMEKYADLQAQKNRLKNHGFDSERIGCGAEAADIESIWRLWVDEKEKERVDGLEWMDEVEEFVLLAQHYCMSWGWRDFRPDDAWHQLTPYEKNKP